MNVDKSKVVRDAATVVVLREDGLAPAILMGQRGANAAFMPSKYVFPGGAVDAEDAARALPAPLDPATAAALCAASTCPAQALANAALRELAEETGQRLADPSGLRFVFRAITPPGRPRRFDARFFLVSARDLVTDPDDFSLAEDELSHLHWVPLAEARALNVPFITEVVLAEVAATLKGPRAGGVPFFDNSGETSVFRRL